jgi:hypothetical protein
MGRLSCGSIVGAGELAQADHRHVQLLGHDLEAREMSETTCAVFAAVAVFGAGGGHQLEIVDDDQPQIVEPAAFGVHLRDCDGGIVVHADVGLASAEDGDAQLGPLIGGELPVTSFWLSTKLRWKADA